MITHPQNNPDISHFEEYKERLDGIINLNNKELIPILQETHELLGFLPGNVLRYIGKKIDNPLVRIYGVITFYNHFRLKPVGKYIIKVCDGTACHVAGAKPVCHSIACELEIQEGNTTSDKLFTLETVACVGCCSQAPVLQINKEIHTKMTVEDSLNMVRNLKNKK